MSPGTSAPPRPRPPIDPRLRARRIAVKRDEGRRRLRRLASAAVATAVLLLAALATRSSLLDVDRVVVTGTERTPIGAVLEASAIEAGDPMTDVDVAAAARRIETLPWVDTATVRRQWPARVAVAVTERTPVATLPADGGGWAIVDADGRVLERTPEQPAALPMLGGVAPAGPPGAPVAPEAADVLVVAAALPETLAERVAAVAAAGDGGARHVRLELRPGGVVELGRPDLLEQKLLAVLAVLEDVAPEAVATLDVRVPSAPVLTRRG